MSNLRSEFSANLALQGRPISMREPLRTTEKWGKAYTALCYDLRDQVQVANAIGEGRLIRESIKAMADKMVSEKLA